MSAPRAHWPANSPSDCKDEHQVRDVVEKQWRKYQMMASSLLAHEYTCEHVNTWTTHAKENKNILVLCGVVAHLKMLTP